MTVEKQDIKSDFYEGDKKLIEFTIRDQNDALKDLSLSEISWALILDDGKNPQTILRKTSTDPAEVEVVSLGVCQVKIEPTDTIGKYGTFRHQLFVVDENGNSGIVSSGEVRIFRSFARRPRNSQQSVYLTGG